jgi:hypothetical protein
MDKDFAAITLSGGWLLLAAFLLSFLLGLASA